MKDSGHLRFEARIGEKGEFFPVNASVVRARLSMWKGKRVFVEVNREKKPRSLQANAYLWGVCYELISEWSGYEPEEVHELMKGMWLPSKELTLPTGETKTITGSTKTLDSGAFVVYVERVRKWASENGLYIPSPGETYEVAL